MTIALWGFAVVGFLVTLVFVVLPALLFCARVVGYAICRYIACDYGYFLRKPFRGIWWFVWSVPLSALESNWRWPLSGSSCSGAKRHVEWRPYFHYEISRAEKGPEALRLPGEGESHE